MLGYMMLCAIKFNDMKTRILRRIRGKARIRVYASNVGKYVQGEIRKGEYKAYSGNCLIEEGDSEDVFWRVWDVIQSYLTKKERYILDERRIQRREKTKGFKRVY